MKTITAEITSVAPRQSQYGGLLYLVTFRSAEGSYMTWISDQMNNYAKWKPLLVVGKKLGNLRIKKDNLINADSDPTIL
jgi:hypothetical protein